MMITYHEESGRDGTKRTINVESNGKPFGQLWTWEDTDAESHPWHAKALNGGHAVFRSLAKAKWYMESHAPEVATR